MYNNTNDDILSDDIQDQLRTSGLFPFVDSRYSSNNKIQLLVYENQKYRPIVGEWGSATGVHLFPAIDRAALSDDFGKHALMR